MIRYFDYKNSSKKPDIIEMTIHFLNSFQSRSTRKAILPNNEIKNDAPNINTPNAIKPVVINYIF